MLLKQLYSIHALFYREWPMINFIREYIREHWWQIAKTCTYSNDDKMRAQERVKEARKRGDL